jgi:putative endonuclease
MSFFVYIWRADETDNLARRHWEHQNDIFLGFTRKYGVKTLVWYEVHESRGSAFQRERQIKKWNRAWKLALIERTNPTWHDLANELA